MCIEACRSVLPIALRLVAMFLVLRLGRCVSGKCKLVKEDPHWRTSATHTVASGTRVGAWECGSWYIRNMAERKYKTIKHQHEVGDLHELTFSCYRKMRLLTNDVWRSLLSEAIDQACKEHTMELVAFVYMPDHVHLLVFPTKVEPDIGAFLTQVKRPTSSRIHELLQSSNSPLLAKLIVRERPGRTSFRFWQEGPGCDRNLFQPASIQASINYIHRNPVEKKLCKRAIDWRWSSATYYLGEPPCQQLPHLPFIHGLRPESLDEGRSRS